MTEQSPSGGVRVGADVGGTFTDVVVARDGRLAVVKTPSDPAAPEAGVTRGVRQAAADAGFDPDEVAGVAHGTTVATNAVLEGEWADTALVTTAGFRDALEIGRQARPDIYDLHAEKPDPVVPRDRRFAVPGRVDERGRVLEPLDEDALASVVDDLHDAGVDSVAVCTLFSFENDAHERAIAAAIEADTDASLSLSSSVHPEIREYERTLVTALNAALKPVMDRYLGNLETDLREWGVRAPLRVMGSAGGVTSASAVRERPVGTLLSGPAAGVRGAVAVAERRGLADVVTMDMGGTSCDVSLVEGGDPLVTTDVEVGDYPVAVPMVDVHTVGAGGGSVAWLDSGGALRVGPKSAGSDPGPVCYGRGGERPTTTDAHHLLGRIDPDAFLPEGMGTDEAAVREAFADVADALGADVETAAQGVLDVANANMERALRVVSVERGYDPREFSLVAFGGAGPLHATALAESLDLPRVLVPRAAGVLSALGLLVSDVRHDRSTSRVRPWTDVDPANLDATFADLAAEGRERLADEGVPADRRRYERLVDLRYVGQSYELSVPAPEDLDSAALERVAERFHERHRSRYGHASPDEPLELVTVRVRAEGATPTPDLAADRADRPLADAVRETRDVVFDGDPRETTVYARERLPTDAAFDGPAIVEGAESTTVVRPGQRVRVDADANLVVEVDP